MLLLLGDVSGPSNSIDVKVDGDDCTRAGGDDNDTADDIKGVDIVVAVAARSSAAAAAATSAAVLWLESDEVCRLEGWAEACSVIAPTTSVLD